MSGEKLHTDQVDIGDDLVRRLIEQQFPQWADLPIERFPSGGTVNAIYRLGNEMYARLPFTQAWAWSLDNETKRLPWLRAHVPFEIPEILARGVAAEGYPFSWSIYRWIEGEMWSLDGLSDEREAVDDFAAVVEALRRLDPGERIPRGMGALSLRDLDAWIRDSISKAQDLIDARAVTAVWDASVELAPFSGPFSWVHADLSADNLLMKDGRLSAVLDWGSVHVGDPTHDIAPVWEMFSREQRLLFREALTIDDATWMRARGWALRAVGAIDYYRDSQPERSRGGVRTIEALLEDAERDG